MWPFGPLVRMFLYLYVLNLPNTWQSQSFAVSSNADDIYLRGWKSDIETDRHMALTSFVAITIFGNFASFMIGKYVRNYVIDNPCTKPCGKLPESMFVSSNCVFQRHRGWTFFSEGVILFSELFGVSGSTLSNQAHLLHKTLNSSRYGVNTKAIHQWRKYGKSVREATLKG